tara:strand:- start:1598 stop:1969 length:372 start_codon:yes stop_codon:yes gene_type:complete
MSGILAKLFGAGDVIKSGMQLIDDLHTSDEEEIAAKSKAKTDLLSAYAPFKIAQRYLALMFGFTFLFSFFLTMLMVVFKFGSIADVKIVIDQFYIGEIMLTIVGFYFAGGAIEGVVGRVKQRN